ncbi:MAG: Ig-like domain-containing protein [Campylobacterota bacterium]
MTYLKLSLLSFSLAALLVGCGTESDEAPLIPEIVSIEIDGTDTNSSVRSLEDELQLIATITYDDGTDSTATSQLDWESNDTTLVTVSNGLVTAVANHGAAAISASYRNKLFTTVDKNITIVPLTDINITSIEDPIVDINYSADPMHADINVSGIYKLTAIGAFEDGESNVTITRDINWTSSNTTIATIDISLGDLNVLTDGHTDINLSIYNEINTSLLIDVNLSSL